MALIQKPFGGHAYTEGRRLASLQGSEHNPNGAAYVSYQLQRPVDCRLFHERLIEIVDDLPAEDASQLIENRLDLTFDDDGVPHGRFLALRSVDPSVAACRWLIPLPWVGLRPIEHLDFVCTDLLEMACLTDSDDAMRGGRQRSVLTCIGLALDVIRSALLRVHGTEVPVNLGYWQGAASSTVWGQLVGVLGGPIQCRTFVHGPICLAQPIKDRPAHWGSW